MTDSRTATHDALVHEVCDRFRAAAGQPACEKCMREADTPYGPGMIGCYLVAEETIELVRKETQSAIAPTSEEFTVKCPDCGTEFEWTPAEAVRPELLGVLDAIEDYLEGHEDIRDGGDGTPLPNDAMHLLFQLREARRFTVSATTPTSEAMAALRELVALKGMKDELERTEPRDLSSPRNYAAEALREDYESRKPAAWDRARAVVHAADSRISKEKSDG